VVRRVRLAENEAALPDAQGAVAGTWFPSSGPREAAAALALCFPISESARAGRYLQHLDRHLDAQHVGG
jgi:hypothetical protein